MQKFLIVLLAVCLVSAHAFVKRETAPESSTDNLAKIKEDFQEMATNIQKQLEATFDKDKLKDQLNKAIDTVSKAIDDIKAGAEKKQ